MSDRQETYIYESPDGGDTVYRRAFGSAPAERELHSISDKKQSLMEELRNDRLWGAIRRAAKTDPVLKEMLDKVIVYHRLKNDD